MYLAVLLAFDLFISIQAFMIIWKAPVLRHVAAAVMLVSIAAHGYFLMNHLQP